jgi:hypothetical protein
VRFPAPKPGLVIRYSFLWSDEADRGAEEGVKDRPCAIVVATTHAKTGDLMVIVAPMTHSPPVDTTTSIEIPPATARALGLDGERQWMRFDELNRFAWPGYDLRQVRGQPGRYDYGMLPKALYEQLRTGILERQKAKALRIQKRD